MEYRETVAIINKMNHQGKTETIDEIIKSEFASSLV